MAPWRPRDYLHLGVKLSKYISGNYFYINMDYKMTTQDRDLLIRVDTDVKHLADQVSDVRTKQTEQDKHSQSIAENLNRLTYNVGAMVEGMKEAREMLHNVGKHNQRIEFLEQWKEAHEVASAKIEDRFQQGFRDIMKQLEEDRKKWEPWVGLACHWKWMLAGGVAVVGFVGWDTIQAVLRSISQ